jgi:hypothetical protein
MKQQTISLLFLMTATLSGKVEFQAHSDRLSVHAAARIADESTDHSRNRGLSLSHADVNGFNFHAGDPSQHDAKCGAIRLNGVVKPAGGAPSGSTEVIFDSRDPGVNAILPRDRIIVFRADVFRADAAKRPPVPKRAGPMTRSAGFHTEKGRRGKRAEWMDYASAANARGYGLFAANPSGAHDFSNGQCDGGAIAVEPGGRLRFRDRVLIHSGRMDAVKLTQAYAEYAKVDQ